MPFTGGFVAKLFVFRSAVDAGQYQLAIVGMFAAAIGAFVYLRLVVTMYATGHDEDDHKTSAVSGSRIVVDAGSRIALGIAAFAVVAIGVQPNWFLDLAHQASLHVFG